MQRDVLAHRNLKRIAGKISPTLRDTIASIGPLWFPRRRTRDLACFLSRAVVGQQLSVHAARAIWNRITDATESNGSSIPEFFSPKNSNILRECGISSFKVKTLNEVRLAKAHGVFSRDLRRLSRSVRSDILLEIWGIGEWTCDMASIFFFKDEDIWPHGDTSVVRGFSQALGRQDLGPDAIHALADMFSPYRSVLALYMWRLLDEPLT